MLLSFPDSLSGLFFALLGVYLFFASSAINLHFFLGVFLHFITGDDTEKYRKWCKKHRYNFSSDKAAEVYGKAGDQIAMLPKDALTKLLVKQAIDALNAVSATLERLKAEMLVLAAQLPEFPVVMDMRGVGDSLGPQLIAEIGT